MKKTATKRAVILLSGGLDSTTLLHLLRKRGFELYALSFNYGQKHSRELRDAAWQARAAGVRRHQVLDISFLGRIAGAGSVLTASNRVVPALSRLSAAKLDQPPTYVPNRNMILLSLAAAWAEGLGIGTVYYGAQAQDEYGYWDCTKDFVSRINRVLSLNRRKKVVVSAPFVGLSKVQVLRKGLALGVNYGHTWSCYRGKGRPCGVCPSCCERARAFAAAGSHDPADVRGKK